jgi:cystathionine beta-lyase
VKYPERILPAWVAEHDFRPPDPVIRAYTDVAEAAAFGYHYRADALGAAYAPWAKERHDWDVDPELVNPHVDVLQGVTAAIMALSNPGDGLILPSPLYFPFWDLPPTTGRTKVEWRLHRDEHGWVFDLDALETLLRSRRDARVMLLCNPHNPTGRVMSSDTVAALIELAHEFDFYIVSDEIHGDLVYSGSEFRPALSLPGSTERVVAVTSAAKTFSLSGIRCAISVYGDEELMTRVREAHPPLLMGRPARGGIETTVAAWECGGPWVDQLLAYLEDNRDHLVERLRAEAPAVRIDPPESTFLAWIDVSECGLGPDPAATLEEKARVGVSEGHEFGPGGEGYIRINFGTSRAILDELLDRMIPHLGR